MGYGEGHNPVPLIRSVAHDDPVSCVLLWGGGGREVSWSMTSCFGYGRLGNLGNCLEGRSHYITFAVLALAGVMSRDIGFGRVR